LRITNFPNEEKFLGKKKSWDSVRTLVSINRSGWEENV